MGEVTGKLCLRNRHPKYQPQCGYGFLNQQAPLTTYTQNLTLVYLISFITTTPK